MGYSACRNTGFPPLICLYDYHAGGTGCGRRLDRQMTPWVRQLIGTVVSLVGTESTVPYIHDKRDT